MAQLTCSHLSLGYEGQAILKDLNFTVHAGDYLCIVGENGSGKSTLMKTILGLQKPISGSITFGDGLRPGEVGAFICGNETYIKVFEEDGLHSLNPAYKTMHFDQADSVYLIGRVTGILSPDQIVPEADAEKYGKQ